MNGRLQMVTAPITMEPRRRRLLWMVSDVPAITSDVNDVWSVSQAHRWAWLEY